MKFVVAIALSAALSWSSGVHAEEIPVVAQEWRGYVEPILPIGERMAALTNTEDPQSRQELYRMIFMGISTAYVGLSQSDPEHPSFWPIWNQAYNWFAPNPDDAYSETPIDGNGVYRISGSRGTVHMVDFQIGTQPLYHGGAFSTAPTLADYFIDTLHIRKDGSFEVLLSNERPSGYKGDWWKLDPKGNSILVRQISYDWLHEVDARLAIERLDRPPIKPRPSAQQIEADLRQIPVWAENWTRMSLQWINKLRAQGFVNKVLVHDLSDVSGVTTQKYIEGLFEFSPDEVLIYETDVPKQCRYWNIELTDMLWSAIDIANRQSNLNGYTAKVDKDGKFRAVISPVDPGVPNWLDTAGATTGSLFGRWTGCSSAPTPTITRVKLADVRKYLPADTPVISAEARDASIRLRRKGAQLRRRW